MTQKQLMVAKDLLENVGKPVGKAMLDAGYTKTMAKNPDHLTKSKGWKELMEQYLPDSKLLQVHSDGLDATRVISAVNTNKEATGGTTDFIEVPDHAVRAKYLELGYKVKNKFEDKNQLNILNQGEMTLEFVK